jgi:hypothetical protein
LLIRCFKPELTIWIKEIKIRLPIWMTILQLKTMFSQTSKIQLLTLILNMKMLWSQKMTLFRTKMIPSTRIFCQTWKIKLNKTTLTIKMMLSRKLTFLLLKKMIPPMIMFCQTSKIQRRSTITLAKMTLRKTSVKQLRIIMLLKTITLSLLSKIQIKTEKIPAQIMNIQTSKTLKRITRPIQMKLLQQMNVKQFPKINSYCYSVYTTQMEMVWSLQLNIVKFWKTSEWTLTLAQSNKLFKKSTLMVTVSLTKKNSESYRKIQMILTWKVKIIKKK